MSAKTQYLVTPSGLSTTIETFRRKRATMLFGRGDEPIRLMNWAEWSALTKDWPHEVASEGLTLRSVWTLVPNT